MDIEFCSGCDGSISRRDAEEGNVVRVGGRPYHRDCAPGGRARAWIPWLVLAPAVALGVLVGVLLGSREPADAPVEDGSGERLERRLDALEGQVRGLSAQLEAAAGERRRGEESVARALGAHEEGMRLLSEDLDLVVEALENLTEALSRPPPPAPVEGSDGPPPLADLLRRAESDTFGTRYSALYALSIRPEDEAAEALRTALADEHRRIRSYAARLLGERGDPAYAGELVALLRDEEPHVRQAAHHALLLVSGMPFPFDAIASEEERAKLAKSWETWWAERQETPPDDGD